MYRVYQIQLYDKSIFTSDYIILGKKIPFAKVDIEDGNGYFLNHQIECLEIEKGTAKLINITSFDYLFEDDVEEELYRHTFLDCFDSVDDCKEYLRHKEMIERS
jgi:hypothetical protein